MQLSYNGNDSQKNGEPFFKSLSAFASDPRRRAVAPVNTYTALSSRWRGLSASDVLAPLLTPLTLWRNPPIGGRTQPYIQCACSSTRLSQQYKKLESKRVRPYIPRVCSWHPPEETQDRRQSDSAEAYMAFPKMLPFCLITPHQSRERQQRQRLRSNLLNPCLETLTAGTLPWGTPPPLLTAMPSHALRALLLR